MLEWFPVPLERKAKIESQIKSGINRVYREIQREEELAGVEPMNGAMQPPSNGAPVLHEPQAEANLVPTPVAVEANQ